MSETEARDATGNGEVEAVKEPTAEESFGSFMWVIGIVTLAGLLVMLLDGLGFGPFDGQGPHGGLALIDIGLLGLVVEGLRTGRLQLRGGKIGRREHPLVFWIFILIYLLIAGGITAFLVHELVSPPA